MSDTWEKCHRPSRNNQIPSHLYTDENPASTIKGTGFKDRETAERTIRLTSQPGVRYKQYWTIRAMRERAFHHPHPTTGMRQAMLVFDDWLQNRYQPPTPEEKRALMKEWQTFRRQTNDYLAANAHSYGKHPSAEELKRSRDDVRNGRECLACCLRGAPSISDDAGFDFPLVAFTAIFGGPGIHGYGTYTVNGDIGTVVIEGEKGYGLEQILGKKSTSQLGVIPKQVRIVHNRKTQMARAITNQDCNFSTLETLWSKSSETNVTKGKCNGSKTISTAVLTPQEGLWKCSACTFVHEGKIRQFFLSCEMCETERTSKPQTSEQSNNIKSFLFQKMRQAGVKHVPNAEQAVSRSCLPTKEKWGSLRAPSKQDISGPRKRQRALDPLPPVLDIIIVLDFEWTADDKRKMHPVAEITQFPSVAMRLVNEKHETHHPMLTRHDLEALAPYASHNLCRNDISHPVKDAYAMSLFDSFVKPTFNPTLTQFSIDLTGITQKQVDASPTISVVLQHYISWLVSLGLVDSCGNRVTAGSTWCFCTWGDVDIMTTLRLECKEKSIPLPNCFDRWINLKDDAVFKRHYGRRPSGGLQSVVDSVDGCQWEGRAHNGLIDSLNTAKIVQNMVRTGYRFTRSTRGLDRQGVPFGSNE